MYQALSGTALVCAQPHLWGHREHLQCAKDWLPASSVVENSTGCKQQVHHCGDCAGIGSGTEKGVGCVADDVSEVPAPQ